MEQTRRHWALALAAAATAASKAADAAAKPEMLPSLALPYDDMKVKTNADGGASRQVLDGLTHSGYHIDMHITTLAPGKMPHPAHEHEHEEMVMLRTGTLEITINGKVTKVGPGSVVYVHSMEHHGWKNIGDTPAEYFVLALGRTVNQA